MVFDRMTSSDAGDVPKIGRKAQASSDLLSFLGRLAGRVVACIDTVVKDFDVSKPILLLECSGAKSAAGCAVVGEPAEQKTVDPAAFGRDHIGIMPTVLGQKDLCGPRTSDSSQCRIEKRCVLVRVNDIDSAALQIAGKTCDDPSVESRFAAKGDDRDSFGLKFLAELTDRVQAEYRRIDTPLETLDDLGHEHLGARDIHGMETKTDPDRH